MGKIRVLVFPAGEINALELHDALAFCVNIELYGASSIERHGGYVFANYISGLPLLDEPGFLPAFRRLLAEKRIDIVFPTHDTVAEFLSAHNGELPAIIMGGDARTCAICRDKAKTYAVFKNEPFCPRLANCGDKLPVFAKPRIGQGSKGARMINDWRDPYLIDAQSLVITEYLPGEEFTVDCLTDSSGRLRVASPRSRLRVMAGISMAGQTEPLTEQIEAIANAINSRLKFLGLWWFQIKRDAGGQWKLLEVSARCAGSMILTRARGLNLPLLSVYTAMGLPIDIHPNAYQAVMDSALIRRFRLPISYSTVYMDFDDTLVMGGKVNLKAIWFAYQCRNEGKIIILLTRHEKEIQESLKSYCISEDLFQKIIKLSWKDSKISAITGKKCIFIDNSWQERQSVQRALGIPVFDVDGIDFLMRWKV